MADGGLRVVLDFSETDIKQAGELMRAKQSGALLEIVAIAVLPKPIDSLARQLRDGNERMSVAFPGIEIERI